MSVSSTQNIRASSSDLSSNTAAKFLKIKTLRKFWMEDGIQKNVIKFLVSLFENSFVTLGVSEDTSCLVKPSESSAENTTALHFATSRV